MGLRNRGGYSVTHVDHGDGLGEDSADDVGAAEVDKQ